VNAPAGHLKCYNLSTDYDEKGNLKRSAKARFLKAETVEDLNKGVWMSNGHWAEVKAWIHSLRLAYEAERKKK
jgi:hypothetical protein